MALGRGLGELLGEIETAYEMNTENTNYNLKELDLNLIEPNPYQPRKIFNDEKLFELSESIKKHGLLQPVVVMKSDEGYILISGERRLRASKLAKLETINAVILDIEKSKLRELALIENIQRDDLNIIEVAYSYSGLINDFDMTHEDLAKLVSKSRSSITNTLRLLTLTSYAQKMLGVSKISVGHAKVILGLEENEQKIVVDSIIGQKLSVRETEVLVKKIKKQDQKEETITSTNQKNNIDYSNLDKVTLQLQENDLSIKRDKNYLKIRINSQDEIDKLVALLNKRV
ncbi:MAG: ParB/RepB/Spo0J family partition protein [Campylobacterota bacterium]|nr:ParB/RepB/Spo0J family partition protein [Campylobacterota bacterium]